MMPNSRNLTGTSVYVRFVWHEATRGIATPTTVVTEHLLKLGEGAISSSRVKFANFLVAIQELGKKESRSAKAKCLSQQHNVGQLSTSEPRLTRPPRPEW